MGETTITPRMIERTLERMVIFGEIGDVRLRSAAMTALNLADDDRGVFFRTAARLVNAVPRMGAIMALEVLTKLGQTLAFSREDDVRAAAAVAGAAAAEAAAAAAAADAVFPDDAELERLALGDWYVSSAAGEGIDQVDQGDPAGVVDQVDGGLLRAVDHQGVRA